MAKITSILFLIITCFFIIVSFNKEQKIEAIQTNTYTELFQSRLNNFQTVLDKKLNNVITKKDIHQLRYELKKIDFWLRYLDPIAYKKLNGPLPIEWETEVFEKHEKPYKRVGAGLTLYEINLEENLQTDSLLIPSKEIISSYQSKSNLKEQLITFNHFYFCNRLFLLNLASIYTTGFECPDTNRIIPELQAMIQQTNEIYITFDESFPQYKLPKNYWLKFEELIDFMKHTKNDYSEFDHYSFIKEYINPLFQLNQLCIQNYRISSRNVQDYSLNNSAKSIFSKNLFQAQSNKGIYHRVKDSIILNQIEKLGSLLFYDPILSGNNQRSCASCHDPKNGFSIPLDKPFHFNGKTKLKRNSPSLLNANYQHLLMLDGKHINLHQQALDVITNKDEMNGNANEILHKILTCKEYKNLLKNISKNTPGYTEITIDHITSALVYYYTKFSYYDAPFDNMMNGITTTNKDVQKGFNLFMGKAACATCHFVPQFNGVKPPFTGSEFEVLGVQKSIKTTSLDDDKGRSIINSVSEMENAFRTNTIRNSSFTAPYMHNGIFNSLEEVIDFYNNGGGLGLGIKVDNQTLSGEKLNLSDKEKQLLISFIKSLDENIPTVAIPTQLPKSKISELNNRIVIGRY